MWSDGGWGWGGWLVMTLSMVAFWGLLVWTVLWVVRAGGPRGAAGPGPERILAERFARGEIDEAEYRRRLDALQAGTRAEDERLGGPR